jgi:hypothetical protein
MGALNRRHRTADIDKITLSAETLLVLPAVADFLDETGKGMRLKAEREGLSLAADILRAELLGPALGLSAPGAD